MKKTIFLNDYKSNLNRKLPNNFDCKDEHLFKDEGKRQIQNGTIYILKNKTVNQDFLVFSIYGFESDSFLYRSSFKPNWYSSVKFLVKNLFFQPKSIIPKGIWITDAWSSGYFHWFGDVLQKIFILKSNNILTDEYVLLLPEDFIKYDYIQDSIIHLNLKVKYIKKNELVLCLELVKVNLPFQSGNYFDEEIKLMNNYFRNLNLTNNKVYKTVYLSRNKATRRKVINDEEIINNFNLLNITTLCSEDLSWNKQLETFKHVDLLISIHGAGLTNMIFMKPGSTIIEFRHPKSNKQNCFYNLACALNLNYFYLVGIPSDEDSHLSDLTIDTLKLKEIVENILLENQ
jgi:capsular polysaccharide biosynthesis protein